MQARTSLSLIALPALAGLSPLARAAAEGVAAGVSSGTFLQAFLGLALVIALLGAAAWLARKLSTGQRFGRGGMQVVGGISLGPRERLVLVEVGEHWLIIGIVPGQIRTLHTLPKGQLDQPAAGSDPAPVFAQWLKNVVERRNSAS